MGFVRMMWLLSCLLLVVFGLALGLECRDASYSDDKMAIAFFEEHPDFIGYCRSPLLETLAAWVHRLPAS